MKHKVGDKVRVISLEKYNSTSKNIHFTENMSKFCGRIVTIKTIKDSYYILEGDESNFWWTDDMFEDEASFFELERALESSWFNKNLKELKLKDMSIDYLTNVLNLIKDRIETKESLIKDMRTQRDDVLLVLLYKTLNSKLNHE